MGKSSMFLLAAVLLAAVSLRSYGEENPSALRTDEALSHDEALAQIDSLQSRVSKLERRAATWENIKKHFKISGYVQAGYNWTDDGTSTFYLRRARLSFAGQIFEGRRGAKADYRLQVDFAGSPKIVDCWVKYAPCEAFGIQIGEFKLPLTIESTEYAPPVNMEFIEWSLAARRLVRYSDDDISGINSVGRDIGAQFCGGFIRREGYDVVNYNLAVFNGSGINRKDDNKSKDFVGRIMVKPMRELTIAAYYQYGEGAYSHPYIASEGRYLALHRYGGGLSYDCKDFFVRGEYLGGTTAGLKSDGAYLAGGYKFLDSKWTAVARVDYFDIDRTDSAREWNYTVGMNYMPWKYLRVQLNYTFAHYCNYALHNTNSLNVMVTAMF